MNEIYWLYFYGSHYVNGPYSFKEVIKKKEEHDGEYTLILKTIIGLDGKEVK